MLSCLSHIRLFVTSWTAACQAPLSMGFSKLEYWSGLSFPPPGDLPDPRTKPMSLMSLVLTGRFFVTSATWEACSVQMSYNATFCLPVFCKTVIYHEI